MSYNRLQCPHCGWEQSQVKSGWIVKISPGGNPICPNCNNLLLTYEVYDEDYMSPNTLPYPLNKFSPKDDRLYLATPYTSDNFYLTDTRYEIALFAAAALIESGFEVYSPIVYTHVLATKYNIKPNDSNFWVALDEGYIESWATGIVIVQLPGYSESTGISRELKLAQELNLQTIYLGMETLYDITRALPSRLD